MNRFASRLLFAGAVGLFAGVLMALPLFTTAQLSGGIYEVANAPAGWLAETWTAAGLPPRGEVAWVVVPAGMILLQWSIVGVIVGAIIGVRLHKKSE